MLDVRCKLCGALASENQVSLKGIVTLVCDDCMYEVASNLPEIVGNKQFDHACDALAWHFAGIPRDQLVSTSRLFPGHMRADVQAAVDRLFSGSPIRFFGIHEEHRYETLSIAALTRDGRNAHAIAPAQYHDVDVGESAPVKCLNNGLWLCRTDGLRYAVVLSSHREYGYESGTRIEIAVPAGAEGAEFVQRCFSELESAVNAARCYRGKVLSLDGDRDYRGRSSGIMVHKLPSVRYNISQQQIVELAPFLFCWAAEASLRQRRDKIMQVERAYENVGNLEQELPHLPASNFAYSEVIAVERQSIENRDLFAIRIKNGDTFLEGTFSRFSDMDNPLSRCFSAISPKKWGASQRSKNVLGTSYPSIGFARMKPRTLWGATRIGRMIFLTDLFP